MKQQLSFIVNVGSVSKKYGIYDDSKQEVAYGQFLKNEKKCVISGLAKNGGRHVVELDITDQVYEQSIDYFFTVLKEKKIVDSYDQVEAIGVRIVAPGEYFMQTRVCNAEYKLKLEQAKDIAPLHIIPTINEIKNINLCFPKAKVIAISDSSFHTTNAQCVRLYAIKLDDMKEFDIFSFGYHGISMQSIMRKLKEEKKELPEKIIVCHLGGGSSITAIKNGKSVDTSMGFSPFEGVPMETRVGSIDPGALLYLKERLGYTYQEFNEYLNRQCGLRGLSGKTGHMGDLLELERQGDEHAHCAIEYFVYNVQKYIGSYCAVLNGLDFLVFTGGIGSYSPAIRSRVCESLSYLNLSIDNDANNLLINKDGFFQQSGALVKVATLVTNEMYEMVLESETFLSKKEQ